MNIKGIDVSVWQGKIDWKKVKASGIVFAMIRVGYGSSQGNDCKMDTYFKANVEGALAAGVEVGIYFYSYAKSAQAAALFDMPQASEAPRPEEAAPQGGRTGEKSTPAERNGAGDGVPVAAVAVAEESGQAQPEKAAFRPPWKLPRPNMGWVHAAAEKISNRMG